MIQYPSEEDCKKGLAHFHKAYLPEHETKLKLVEKDCGMSVFTLEDGWLGYRRVKNRLGLIFESPDEDTARGFLSRISFHP